MVRAILCTFAFPWKNAIESPWNAYILTGFAAKTIVRTLGSKDV